VRSKVSVQPTIEPVTLDELKASLRVTHAAEDALLTQFIQDAREFAEIETGRKFITQTIVTYYTNFNYGGDELWWNGERTGAFVTIHGNFDAEIEFGPAQSITSIDTVALDNSEAVYLSSNYYLDNYDDDLKPRVVLNDGATTPTDLRATNNIKVTWVAGYGATAADVPSGIRRAILILAGALYKNRGDCEASSTACSCGATAMLRPYKFLDV